MPKSGGRQLGQGMALGVQSLKRVAAVVPLAGLGIGIALLQTGDAARADQVFAVAAGAVLAVLLLDIAASLRRGEVGLDLVAALSMSAALWFGEELAAAVVALMYAGGSWLEAYAEGRATREMRSLLSRMPRTAVAHRDGALVEVPIGEIQPGDRLLVRTGEVTPVDGTVAEGVAVLDRSALTGESMPVRHDPGAAVMSGATNAGDAFDMIATHEAAESTYAGIVRLVENAQKSRAPMARMADRYALGFLAVTVAIAGWAWWWAGDPIRAVAVLVVATPCPLILAVPVALVSGLSRAAGQGVLVKGGRALEALARVRVVVLDKTGTLTDGRPKLLRVRVTDGISEADALALAAALEQGSKHPVAQAIVAEARARGLDLAVPQAVRESPGDGVEGVVAGRRVVVGGERFVRERLGLAGSDPEGDGDGPVLVGVAGEIVARLDLADPLRPETGDFLAALPRFGIERVVLATGDRPEVARRIAAGLPIDHVAAGLAPADKVMVVLAERKFGTVMMVGDGVNDAPALAASDVGVAMGVRGAAASAEAADVVLLVDEVARVLQGMQIAQAARRIALQSVVAGLGLSVAGMVAAALGYLPPVQGAILQEVIDVAVILNALRVLRVRPQAVRGG
ncbi:MAG: hypothetical protein RLZZ528_222 [Pseudomonadota bacterium]